MAEPVYSSVIGFARTVFRYLGLKFDVTGAELVPLNGGAVVAMNHIGYLDFALAGFAFRPRKRMVRFMAKKEVFDHKISGPLMRGMKHIPVDREAGAGSYTAAVEALRAGELVGVFPEATISQSFELKEFKNGAVRMALESGTPIIPLVIWGSQRVWTKGRPKMLKRNHVPIRIVVGEPFVPADTDPTLATKDLKARMQVLLDEARGTYPDRPEDSAWWMPASLGGSAPTLEAAEAADAEERAARAARRAR
ncbi:MAG: 1-acyl-sn-glycerol-3-phosphate acyltransferase [Frankiales bacterium]|jgi:1-acyl-sn-glycerol-3-phosphate acyltransferase|nr:1-acyl-sn-glycerol-3-phosphate acyltransferase [Frankiales bacterium]